MRRKGAGIPVSGTRLLVNGMLRVLFIFTTTLISVSVVGQSNYQVLSRIDAMVEQIDSLSNKSQRTFYLNKIDKKFDGIKETWNYTARDGKIIVFQIRYVLDSTEFTEVYYINRGDLIYSEEYETVYYKKTGDDEIKWGGIYYFVSNNLRQRVTIGKKKQYYHWNAESETLSRFQRRFSELQQHLPLTAKN